MSSLIEGDFGHPDDSSWVCECGTYIEDGLHCGACGREPPWGCDCDICSEIAEERYAEWRAELWPTD